MGRGAPIYAGSGVDDPGVGWIRRIDPVLFQFNLWAITESYATRMSEVRYMLEMGEDKALDVDHIVTEITEFVLGGIGL